MSELAQQIVAQPADSGTAVCLTAGTATWKADLSVSAGGAGSDPTPHELLDSALAACTLLTLQLYAKRKQYQLESIRVRVHRDEGSDVYKLERQVTLEGALDDAQEADLLRVANACPIHKALGKRFEIATAFSSK